MTDIHELKVLLSSEFDTKGLGAAHKILRMMIHRDRKQWKLFLSMESCIPEGTGEVHYARC